MIYGRWCKTNNMNTWNVQSWIEPGYPTMKSRKFPWESTTACAAIEKRPFRFNHGESAAHCSSFPLGCFNRKCVPSMAPPACSKPRAANPLAISCQPSVSPSSGNLCDHHRTCQSKIETKEYQWNLIAKAQASESAHYGFHWVWW